MQAISKKIIFVSLVLSLFSVGCLESLKVLAAPPSGSTPGDGKGVILISGTFNSGAITLTSAPANSLTINASGAVSIPGALTVASCTGCGGGAPTGATYITNIPDNTLSAEQALSALATGYVKVTTATGALTSQTTPIPVTDGGTGSSTGSITGTGTLIFTSGASGGVAIKPGANAVQAIQLQTASGGTALLNVDSTNLRVGILTSTPYTALHVNGAALLPGSTSSSMTRPAVGVTRITGEVAGGSSSSLGADDGFIRISAGGGTAATTKSYIDLSGSSSVTDMNKNIVFGTSGVEKARLDSSGDFGIGVADPIYKLDVASNGASTARLGTASGDSVDIGGGAGKINVGTVDPPYTINGKGYSTYVTGMTGQKEETAGILKLLCAGSICKKEINFGSASEGSDLWLFAKTTNLKNNFGNMVVLITPAFDGKVWYEKDVLRNKLTVFAAPTDSSNSPEVSYRLTAPRFDAQTLSNFRSNIIDVPGLIIND